MALLTKVKGQSTQKKLQVIQLVFLVVGVVVGIGLGISLQPKKLSNEKLRLIGLPGEVFMRGLMLIAMPLIVSSLVTAFAELRYVKARKIFLRMFLYYSGTTFLSTITGILLCVAIRPGVGLNIIENELTQPISAPHVLDTATDLIRNLFPDNFVKATLSRTMTKKTNVSISNETYIFQSAIVDVNGTNYLGLVLFSIIIGIITGQIGKEGNVVVKLNKAIFRISIKMIYLLMWYAPVGILFLIASNIANVQNVEGLFQMMGMFLLTNFLALTIHTLVSLPIIYYIFIRRNPFKYYLGMIPAFFTVFGTDSSSATLPVTLRCVEETNKVNKKISRMVLTIGSTINMDGTALFEAMAPIFLFQLHGYQLNIGTIATIWAMAIAASVGAAGVPNSGIVFLTIVLQSCGLPPKDIFLFLPFDWLCARCRGLTNISGDGVGAAVIAHLSRDEISEDIISQKNRKIINDEVIEMI